VAAAVLILTHREMVGVREVEGATSEVGVETAIEHQIELDFAAEMERDYGRAGRGHRAEGRGHRKNE
jgi:hypothetical protein